MPRTISLGLIFLFNIFRFNFRKFRPQTLYKFSEVKYNDTVNTPNSGVCSQEGYMKKKIFALVLVVALVASVAVGLAACNDSTDWDYIAEKGEMVIGITYFAPMNYMDDEGNLIGFETEFATAACELLGVTPRFQVVEWDSKIVELQSYTVDCIWNGMTILDSLRENMDISNPYMSNRQVAVIRSADASIYTDLATLTNARLGAERGSAGERAIEATTELADNNYTALEAQSNVLLELASGAIDVGFIDIVMATASVGEGTSYSNLVVLDSVMIGDDEYYGIGLRKDSPETLAKINGAIKTLYDNGTLLQIAEKYGLASALVPQD